jgi:hypothetical protein
MKTETKTISILITIFILGILLGVVIDRTLVEHQMKSRMKRLRNPGMIGFFLERVIQPTSEQREEIENILDKYADKMFQARQQAMEAAAATMDSLRNDLEPILTEEQKKRMEEHRMRFESRGRGKGRFPGPKGPPFGDPPERRFP